MKGLKEQLFLSRIQVLYRNPLVFLAFSVSLRGKCLIYTRIKLYYMCNDIWVINGHVMFAKYR